MLNQPQVLPQPYLTPEVQPSRDEVQPTIGPNLADNPKLCETLTRFIVNDYWYPALQQQIKFWPIWRKLDEAWRASMQAIDLDLMSPTLDKKNVAAAQANTNDGFTLKVSPTDFHKQMDSLLKVGMQISWLTGMPVQAVKGENVFETLYNPVESTVEAANEILSDTAHDSNLQTEYRKNLHPFLKYGHSWAWCDLKRTFETVNVVYRLGTDMVQAQAGLQVLAQRHGQPPQIGHDQTGLTATFLERRVKEFTTKFKHLNCDDVFTDLSMSCEDMDTHPCPMVRQHLAEHQLEQNAYDPQTNPFGWINIQTALTTTNGHYTLNAEDEGVIRQKLEHRFGVSDQNIFKSEHTKKQLWTCYAMLRIAPDGTLDTGNGVDCPACNATGSVTNDMGDSMSCQNCTSGKARPIAQRFIVQFYGAMRGPQTCIRIQPMPAGMKVPLLFAADMVEDTSCAIPISKGEVALNDLYILAESENLFLHSKKMAVHRGWKKKIDSPSYEIDLDKPGVTAPFDSSPNEIERFDAATFDETLTLAPYMQERRERIKNICGATDQLIGQIESGRRTATELGNAIDASKNPIVVMIDNYNRQMMGGWAETVIRNLDLWGDRDWIRKKTGREFFGTLRFKTAVGEEFVKKLTRISNAQMMMQMLPAIIPVYQQAAEIVPKILDKLLDDMGMGDMTVPDGGTMKAQQDAMRIVAKILGDGQLLPPGMDDPDQVYISVFTDAIRAAQGDPDDYWYNKCTSTLPLLIQRLQMQQQIALQKQQQQMMQQHQMQMIQAHAQAVGSGVGKAQVDGATGAGRTPAKGPRPAANHGEAMQNAQGPRGAAA